MNRSFSFTARGLLGTLLALLVAGICIRLGIWQLDRRVERLTSNEVISARMSEPTLALAEMPSDTTELSYRLADFEGEYDAGRGIVLAGRSNQGVGGVHLLLPLRLDDGGAILVNRGWLPSLDASKIDPLEYAPAGRVRVHGLLLSFPELGRAGQGAGEAAVGGDFRRLWYRLDGAGYRDQSPYPLSTLYLQELPEEAAPGSPIGLPLPELDPGPHLGYAIQWFIFATIGLVGWGILLFRGSSSAGGPREREVSHAGIEDRDLVDHGSGPPRVR